MKQSSALLVAALLLAGCNSQLPAQPQSAPQAPVAPANSAKVDTKQTAPGWFTMTSKSEGWAIATDGVFRTVDGGNRWTSVTPSGFSIPGPSSSYFYDADNAWIAARKQDGVQGGAARTDVLYTHDGGKTWSSAAVDSHDLGQFQFTDARHGWAVSEDGHATAMGVYRVFHTVDGGATWTEVASNRYVARANFPGAYMVTGVSFRDNATGWAAGDVRDMETPWLYMTKDGGASWQEAGLNLPQGLLDGSPATQPPMFFDQHKAILPVVSRRYPGQACAVFFRSDDGGASWQSTKAVPCEAGPMAYDFVDAEHGFVTDGKKLYATGDAGKHWESIVPSVSLFGVKKIDFLSVDVGWALTEEALLKTTDGGHTWTPVALK